MKLFSGKNLEAIGRSGAVGQFGQNVFNNALAFGQFQMQQGAADRDAQIRALQMQKLQAEQEDYNREVDVDEIPAKLSAAGQPALGKFLHSYVNALGNVRTIKLPDGTTRKMMKRGQMLQSFNEIGNLMGKMPEWGTGLTFAQWEDARSARQALETSIAEGKEKDPEAAKMKLADLRRAEGEAMRNYETVRTGSRQQAEPLERVIGEGGKPVFVPRSQAAGKQPYEGGLLGYKTDEVHLGGNKWQKFRIDAEGNASIPVGVPYTKKDPNAPAVTINNFDKDTIKGAIKELPKLKADADNSERGIKRIDQMQELIKKGAGGRVGQIKAWAAPTLEIFGIKSQGLAEAQLYETLAKTLGGSFRTEIVGPGQVSNYENELLQKISGGGGTATEAAKELLDYYRSIAESNVSEYNSMASAVYEESPASRRMYPQKKLRSGGGNDGNMKTAEDFFQKKGVR